MAFFIFLNWLKFVDDCKKKWHKKLSKNSFTALAK